MPNALRIGLLGPLQVRDETGRPVRVGGRQLRVLLTLLALNAGRVVPAGSLAGHIWPDQSRWREFPNMISSQDGTEDRRPRAALRPGRAACSPTGCATDGTSAAGAAGASGSAAGGVAAWTASAARAGAGGAFLEACAATVAGLTVAGLTGGALGTGGAAAGMSSS